VERAVERSVAAVEAREDAKIIKAVAHDEAQEDGMETCKRGRKMGWRHVRGAGRWDGDL
jgi:hypothetical protein